MVFQKEKSKGKSHPFAGYLDSDEDILWMTMKPPPSVWRSVIVSCRAYCVLWAFCALIMGIPMISNPYILLSQLPFLFLSTAFGIVTFIGLSLPHALWLAKQPIEYAYAVTNKQLLYRHLTEIWCAPLNVTIPRLSDTKHSQGTLSFGQRLSQWKDIDDAADVQQIIVQAQQNHTKILKQ